MDIQELYSLGYRQGRPTWGIIDGGSIDAEVCATSKCDNCGHYGMEYKGFVKDETKSYRAFAICPECGNSYEF